MKKIFILPLIALLLSACLPQDTQIPQSPLLPLLERKSGLIAFIGADGNMYIADQAGGKSSQLTDDAQVTQSDAFRYYQFPVWSKDGSQVAFGSLSMAGDAPQAELFVHNLQEESMTRVYSSQSEFPIYINWSPDNARVNFITTTARQDNIILKSASAAGGEGTILDAGAPYYWSWAPDGSVLIAHSGSASSSVPAHFSFLQLDTGVTEYTLDIPPASFQAPAWSPDGSLIALTRLADGKNEIIVTDSAGADPKTIGAFTAKTAFAWSFDSTKLAYLDARRTLSDGTIGYLHVHDLESGEEIIEEQNIVAFFWSPNGEEIAYFILIPITPEEGSQGTSQQYGVQLNVLDVTSGESRELFTYRPTEQFLDILPYFDQYHQSATIWSPDNNNLVISFLDNENIPGIAIVPASGSMEPRLLANGYIAFWSWE